MLSVVELLASAFSQCLGFSASIRFYLAFSWSSACFSSTPQFQPNKADLQRHVDPAGHLSDHGSGDGRGGVALVAAELDDWTLRGKSSAQLDPIRTQRRELEGEQNPLTLWKAGRWFSSCFSLKTNEETHLGSMS